MAGAGSSAGAEVGAVFGAGDFNWAGAGAKTLAGA